MLIKIGRLQPRQVKNGLSAAAKDAGYSTTFDFLYKHQGFLVIAKEHLRALTQLLDYCKLHNIEYVISAIQDPMDQLSGLDYIRNEICELLKEVSYDSWLRFNGTFIDRYLRHTQHPSTKEHQILCNYIIEHFKQGKHHGKTI